jgi:hypothetical protein
MESFEHVLNALRANGSKVRTMSPTSATAQCPAHDDNNPSLAIGHKDGKTLIHCFSGCLIDEILTALNLTPVDLFDDTTSTNTVIDLNKYRFNAEQPANPPNGNNQPETLEWEYVDADWQPHIKVIKQRLEDGTKTFRQMHYNGFDWQYGLGDKQPVLYQLPTVIAMAQAGHGIIICEGEKDADTYNNNNTDPNMFATTAPMGAGKWRNEYTEALHGASIVHIIHDLDDPGIKHATKIAQHLDDAGIAYKILAPATGKDLTDHINAGYSINQLIDQQTIIEQAKTEAADKALQRAIDDERIKQTARDTVRKQIGNEQAANRYTLPIYTKTLTDELEITDQPLQWIINNLWPQDANISLTAPFKGGKTSTTNNVIRALADKEPLFDCNQFIINNTGRIAIWNYEVSPNQYRQWLRDLNITNTNHITVLNMRGHTWPIIHQYIIDNTINWLQTNNIETWIIDPLARAFVGCGDENSNADMGIFCDTLDYIKDQAGVRNLMIIAHTGRNAEQGNQRARGASRFDDWADVRWTLTKDTDGQRWFEANGRDVSIPESRLDWNDQTRRQTIAYGIGKTETKLERDQQRVYDIIDAAEPNGINRQGIINTYKAAFKQESLSKESADTGILGQLQNKGLIYKTKVGNSSLFRVTNNQLQVT